MSRHLPSAAAVPLLACLLLAGGAAAEDAPVQQQRVFICAHSFMTFIARLLPPMAASAGVPFALAGHQMIGGSQVIQHWDLPGDKAKPALRSGAVDTLILSPALQMPDPGIDNFAKLGVAANPRLRVLVQASWPAFDDPGSATVAEFQLRANRFANAQRDAATAASLEALRQAQRRSWGARLEAQVKALNLALGGEVVRIVPVNEAVFALRQRVVQGTAPGLAKQTDLFLDPIGHPSPPLCVLVAYCHFAAIWQRSPVGLPVPAELRQTPRADELNRVLQEIAWQAVGPAK